MKGGDDKSRGEEESAGLRYLKLLKTYRCVDNVLEREGYAVAAGTALGFYGLDQDEQNRSGG